jgi:hypothetical protein
MAILKQIYKVVFDKWLRRLSNMYLKEEFKLQIGADYYQKHFTPLSLLRVL